MLIEGKAMDFKPFDDIWDNIEYIGSSPDGATRLNLVAEGIGVFL